MRKLIILFVAVMPLVWIGCEKNEPKDPNALTKENLVGKWNIAEGYVDGKWIDSSSLGWYAKFNSDMSYQAKVSKYTYSGTWSLAGKRVTCDVSGFKVYYDILEFSAKAVTIDLQYEGETGKLRLKAVKE